MAGRGGMQISDELLQRSGEVTMPKNNHDMTPWVKTSIEVLKRVKPLDGAERQAVQNTIWILERGQGWLTGDQPIKIFFYNELP